ncbi:MAG: ribosome biogenesis GTPase YlqF, partial [Firmicutes bacterium]|nr:ribosome biogenesis GTPase YlqF [Bacillota bacterium]
MQITWYPGHMAKALRQMKEEIKFTDIIFYVLDARAPFSCFNPKIEKIVENKPIIYILNKIDMADEQKTKEAKSKFQMGEKRRVITLDASKPNSAKVLVDISKELLKEKIERLKNKGINTSLRAMVVGVPNSGKSSIINNLAKEKRVVTGNRPGVTRGKLWIRVSDFLEVLDTPGTLWPTTDNIEQKVWEDLAFIGSIKQEILPSYEVSLTLIKRLTKTYPELL